MLEFALVFCIAGALMGGIYIAINDVRHKYQNEKLDRQVFGMVGRVRSAFINTPTFSVPTDATLLAKLYPQDAVMGGSSYFHAYGGTITLGNPGGINPQFVITVANLPQAACVYMLTHRLGTSEDVAKMGAVATTISASPLPSQTITGAITITAATSLCASASSNTISYLFDLREPQ